MWNIRGGPGGEAGAGACGGMVWGGEHSAPLVDAAFSPDGTALATASADGYVMFFQVSVVRRLLPLPTYLYE